MLTRSILMGLLAATSLLAASGCNPKETEASRYPDVSSAANVTPVVKALTQQMRSIPAAKVSSNQHLGRKCVIVAKTPTRRDPPPPPMGMVRLMGPVVIYAAQIRNVSDDAVEIEANYPTSGNVKVIAVPKAEIESFYVAN